MSGEPTLLNDLASRLQTALLEIERLRRDCGEAYQCLGAALLDPTVPHTQADVERVLDNLLAAREGKPRPHDDLLPWPKQTQALQLSAAGCPKLGCCPDPDACEEEAGEQATAQELLAHCRQFIQEQDICFPETIHQTDRVIENAYTFIEGVCDIAGYKPLPDES